MARVDVYGATVDGGRVQRLSVGMARLPRRTIDRDTAIAWMKDGHTFVPRAGDGRGPALQLVEVGDDGACYIRTDNAPEASDALPALPQA